MTVSPRYDQYKDAWDTSVVAEVNFHSTLYVLGKTSFCGYNLPGQVCKLGKFP